MGTLRLDGNHPQDVALAGEILRRGGVVAIPTETVYGLAANALDADAARKIFAAKGRPADNPLIVHICDTAQLELVWAAVPPAARTLAHAFWPGPLSVVLPRSGRVPDAVTGGLDTVGVRMPAHPVARAVIAAAGVPLAAPSANLSGRPSATTAQHVLADFDGLIDAVVDGGPCGVGVESTVVSLVGPVATILRPGAVTQGEIAATLGAARTAPPMADDTAPLSPGMKYTHYATHAPITLFTGAPADTAARLAGEARPDTAVIAFEEDLPPLTAGYGAALDFGPSWDHETHARRLFALLREADSPGRSAIYVQAPRPHGRGAATRNRLWRASGGREIPCSPAPVVGITGRSGAGKSVLAAHFQALGAAVLDADAIYARLLAEDADLLADLAARFPAVVQDGQLNRRALGAAVFADAAALADLSAITHPYVARAMLAQLAGLGGQAAVLDVPVLFGSGIDRLCTATVGIISPESASAARIMRRDGMDETAALGRIRAQREDAFFRRRCDVIVENTGSRAAFLAQADALAENLGLGL